MKYTKILLYLLLAIALLWPATAYAKEPFEDKVVFGGTYTLESEQTRDGNLVVFGGSVTLETDSLLNGDLVLIGGTVGVDGNVNGNLIAVGGVVRLKENAIINEDLVTVGATLNREEGSHVNGQVITGVDFPFTFSTAETVEVPSVSVPVVRTAGSRLLDVVWFFFRTFMWAAFAILLVMFLSPQADRIAQAAITQPLITGAAGLVTAILAPLALIAMTITIILIPVTLVAIIVLVIAWLVGLISLGLEVGKRIALLFNQEWAPAVAAGIGTFVLLFILNGFAMIDCIGWIPQTLVGLWGLGAVLLTRFGTQDYPEFAADATISAGVVAEASEPDPPLVEEEILGEDAEAEATEVLEGEMLEETLEEEDPSDQPESTDSPEEPSD
jgi:hypothetical protein